MNLPPYPQTETAPQLASRNRVRVASPTAYSAFCDEIRAGLKNGTLRQVRHEHPVALSQFGAAHP